MANKNKKNAKDKQEQVNGVAKKASSTSVEQGEADTVKQMIADMPKTVEKDSEWYIVSMAWINQWQQYVGFDCEA